MLKGNLLAVQVKCNILFAGYTEHNSKIIHCFNICTSEFNALKKDYSLAILCSINSFLKGCVANFVTISVINFSNVCNCIYHGPSAVTIVLQCSGCRKLNLVDPILMVYIIIKRTTGNIDVSFIITLSIKDAGESVRTFANHVEDECSTIDIHYIRTVGVDHGVFGVVHVEIATVDCEVSFGTCLQEHISYLRTGLVGLYINSTNFTFGGICNSKACLICYVDYSINSVSCAQVLKRNLLAIQVKRNSFFTAYTEHSSKIIHCFNICTSKINVLKEDYSLTILCCIDCFLESCIDIVTNFCNCTLYNVLAVYILNDVAFKICSYVKAIVESSQSCGYFCKYTLCIFANGCSTKVIVFTTNCASDCICAAIVFNSCNNIFHLAILNGKCSVSSIVNNEAVIGILNSQILKRCIGYTR